ncbi:unnamed protein product [Paramecium primaurelia]|uniref:CID domain-containing protein n=1 Tax=Paramecium primaurelia TaxID=5886 RepID=A0A8S1NJ58_PARPR|nr:unnamed protein product [Paramecium primaurelia]
MDIKQLERQVKEITELQDSIKQTSNYCSTFPEHSGMVAFIIENEFISARKERKKLYLFLIHQIILDEKNAKRMDFPYVKCFGQKLKKLILDYAYQVDDIADLEKAYNVIRRWEKDLIYHPIFLDKLRGILQPKYDELKYQQMIFNQIHQNELASNKILVQNLQIIQQFDSTYKLYLHLKSLRDIDDKCLDFNTNFDKYMMKCELEKIEDYEMIDDLLEQGEASKNYLSENICQTQIHYLDLARLGEQLIKEDYEKKDNKIEYYKSKRPIQ